MSVYIWPGEFIKEDYLQLFEEGIGEDTTYQVRSGIRKGNIQKEIVDAVKDIVSKNDLDYSDIAILYPQKDNKGERYYIQHWVKKALEKSNIPYSCVNEMENGQGVSLSNEYGVVVSSIDAIEGLEFKAVILTGLYPFAYFGDGKGHRIKLNDWDAINELMDEQRLAIQMEMTKLYKACLRAKEVLYVINDIETDSIIDDIFCEKDEEFSDQFYDSILDDLLSSIAL